jgi:hypothetical protein
MTRTFVCSGTSSKVKREKFTTELTTDDEMPLQQKRLVSAPYQGKSIEKMLRLRRFFKNTAGGKVKRSRYV